MKKLVLFAILTGLSTSIFASKIGYVDTQALYSKYSQTKNIRESLAKEKKKLEDELQKQNIDLQKIQVELQAKGENVTAEEKKAFEDKYIAFQKNAKESQKKLLETERKKMQEVERLMSISIQNVARTDKYDYILERGALKFGGTDVTSKVLKVMESREKVK